MDVFEVRALEAYQQGRHADAVDWCDRRRDLRQKAPTAMGLRIEGMARLALDDFDAAQECLRQALEAAPHDGELLNDCALALLGAGRPAEAIPYLERAISVAPHTELMRSNLGNALRQSGDLPTAERTLRALLDDKPTVWQGWMNLGLVLMERGQTAGAVEAFGEGLTRAEAAGVTVDGPEGSLLVDARVHRINCLVGLGWWAEADQASQAALEVASDNPSVWNALGLLCLRTDRPDDAVEAYRKGLELAPDDSRMLGNLGAALFDCGAPRAALTACDAALAQEPDASAVRMNRAAALLCLGDYRQGFTDWEARWQTTTFQDRYRKPVAPEWDGTTQPGARLLVRNEQAFGDALMMARLLTPAARRLGRNAEVIVECHPPVAPLMAGIAGVSSVVATGKPWPAHDFQIGLMSLPRVLGLTANSVPAGPYLTVPAEARRWVVPEAKPLGHRGGPVIGLCWGGRPVPRNRSVPFAALWEAVQEAAGGHRVRWVCLQADERRDQVRDVEGLLIPPAPNDFAETAAVVAQLDLVITIDSAMLHLAGGLGVPLVGLLLVGADWRYGLPGQESPWYPRATLFRQRILGDWSHPLAELKTWLADRLETER